MTHRLFRRITIILMAFILLCPAEIFGAANKPVTPEKIDSFSVEQDGRKLVFSWDSVKYAVSYNIYATIINENGKEEDYLVDTVLEDSIGYEATIFEDDQGGRDYWNCMELWPYHTEYYSVAPVTALNVEGPKSERIAITAIPTISVSKNIFQDYDPDLWSDYLTETDINIRVEEPIRTEKDQKFFVKNQDASMTSLTMKWDKVDDVSAYQIYRKTSSKGSFQKVASTTSTKYTSKKLNKDKTYYFKIVALKKDGTKETSNTVKKVKVRGNYKSGSPYGPRLSESKLKQIGNEVAYFVNTKIDDNMTQMDKAAVAHHYLAAVCNYDFYFGKNFDNAYGALVERTAQCSGYTRAYKALCDAMGITCRHIYEKGGSHQFNMVKINGTYYIVDVQLDSLSHVKCGMFRSTKSYKAYATYDTSKYPKCPKNYFSKTYYEDSTIFDNQTYYEDTIWW